VFAEFCGMLAGFDGPGRYRGPRGRHYVSVTLGDAPDSWLLVLLLGKAFRRCVVVVFPKTSFSLYVKFFFSV
jgi:hypothetical protein